MKDNKGVKGYTQAFVIKRGGYVNVIQNYLSITMLEMLYYKH